MLSYFPQVRNEESTYSIFSRMQFAIQPLNVRIMGTMLFNNSMEVGRLNFQSNFDYLCNNLPLDFTSQKFLHYNTIYPLFKPFLSTEKQEKALKYFKGNYPSKINSCLQIGEITKGRSYIRVCKECIKEDLNIYGEPYYRRQHEIELNRVCNKHLIPLYEYNIFPYRISRRYDNFCTVLSNSKEIIIPEKFKKNFLNISEDINTIFILNLDNWSIENTNIKIATRLAELGFKLLNSMKSQREFAKVFKSYYTEEFLDYIGYNFDVNKDGSWIRQITRQKPVADPLKYILLIRFLFGNFEKFYNYSAKYSIFIEGPYPCLNKICPNYNKLVIKDIMQVKRHNGYSKAIFQCEHCGFTYSRRGPDKNYSDIYNKTYVYDYGHLWHTKLKEYVNNGFGFVKISNLLQYKNKEKLITLIDEYKSTNLINIQTKELINKPDNLLIEQYKEEILSYINENPNANIKSISTKKAYRYLLKYDNEWVLNTTKLPKKIILQLFLERKDLKIIG